MPTSTISISTGAASVSPQSIPPASCGGRQTEVGVSEHRWCTVSLQKHQVCHLRARLQADTPVYSILNCDAGIKVLGTCVFAKVAPVNLMGVLKRQYRNTRTVVRKISYEIMCYISNSPILAFDEYLKVTKSCQVRPQLYYITLLTRGYFCKLDHLN